MSSTHRVGEKVQLAGTVEAIGKDEREGQLALRFDGTPDPVWVSGTAITKGTSSAPGVVNFNADGRPRR